MLVHAGRCQNMRAIHGHALRLVDGRGVTVVDMGIVFDVKSNAATIVEQHRHPLRVDRLQLTQTAIFYAKLALIAQEHHAVACCKAALAAFSLYCNVLAKLS